MTSGDTPWEAVAAAIDLGDPERVAAGVLALDRPGRRAVAAALPAHIAVASGRDDGWIDAMRIAGAGAIGGAAAVVAWLNRRDFQGRGSRADDVTALLVRVLSARPPAWQADFAARAALGLRSRCGGGAGDVGALALAMLRHTGVAPPEHDPLVVAWVSRPQTAAGLRADPLLDHLLPRLFEAEGVGRALRDERPGVAVGRERAGPAGSGAWLTALTALAQDGVIGRDLLIDGCLRRFLRGGTAADLRFFVHLHELLDPAHGEVSKRVRDYLRVLPAAPGPVAEPALRCLRRVGGLDAGEVPEAVRALLSRPERKLVTAGLAWFDELARTSDGELDELAPALAYAFACPSGDVQGRAVRLAIKHAKRFGPAGAEALRDAVGLLPQDLGETLAAVFGGEAGEDEGFTPVPLPEPRRAGPFPPPVGSVAELGPAPHGDAWEAAELWLAGVVRLHALDRAGLVARLAGDAVPREVDRGPWTGIRQWAGEIVRLLQERPQESGAEPPPAGGAGSPRGAVVGKPVAARLPSAAAVSAPHLFLLRRWSEVHDGLRAGSLPPYLLAEPTQSTGHLDPAELVRRLKGYERCGAEAMPADLRQALLRLPRAIPPEVVARAGRLTSEAGRAVARWMDGGRPEPVTEVGWSYSARWEEPAEYLDDREPVRGPSPILMPRIQAGPAPDDGLLAVPAPRPKEGHGGYLAWWPSMMPSDREVVALHFLPQLLYQWPVPVRPSQARALALAGGPAGEALALVQAYFVADRSAGRSPEDRTRSVVEMAARGELDAEQLGRQLALLLRRTWFKPGPVLETLESAAALGAHREVWRVMTGFLPVFLPGPGERPHARHAQALAFALRAARWAGARGPVPCVAEVAALRASNNVVREARRLHTFLT
ncbi:hypothetical protein ACQEVF_52100 [Nonomuraea polychroma]|uniref:hypothetical protein n=1 Tax=Nonomuraea polychroma TaxID=46176 RepID=UPI003D8B766F